MVRPLSSNADFPSLLNKTAEFVVFLYFDSHSKQPSELWPSVNENWWCGEFRARAQPDKH